MYATTIIRGNCSRVQINRPLTCREYKIMLVPGVFNSIIKGFDKSLDIIESQIRHNLQLTKEDTVREYRKAWFLDTSNFDLTFWNDFQNCNNEKT